MTNEEKFVMAERNEVAEISLRELREWGLSGRMEERGKHLAICWDYPNGVSRFAIVARTASDWRAVINARGQIRRMLRADSWQRPDPVKVQFVRAMELPRQDDGAAARIQRLERDMEALIDFNADLQAEVLSLNQRLVNLRVTATVHFDAPPPVTEDKPIKAPERNAINGTHSFERMANGKRYGVEETILGLLSFDQWKHRSEIHAVIGGSDNALSTALNTLKQKGRAINGQRGYWKKVAPKEASVDTQVGGEAVFETVVVQPSVDQGTVLDGAGFSPQLIEPASTPSPENS